VNSGSVGGGPNPPGCSYSTTWKSMRGETPTLILAQFRSLGRRNGSSKT
jgi:hypothetical protein